MRREGFIVQQVLRPVSSKNRGWSDPASVHCHHTLLHPFGALTHPRALDHVQRRASFTSPLELQSAESEGQARGNQSFDQHHGDPRCPPGFKRVEVCNLCSV